MPAEGRRPRRGRYLLSRMPGVVPVDDVIEIRHSFGMPCGGDRMIARPESWSGEEFAAVLALKRPAWGMEPLYSLW